MSLRVLVADDSGTMRKIISRTLNELDITDITQAENGEVALSLCSKDQFDLILTDWNMPGKTGIQLVAAIRETDTKTPIIMVTTEAEKRRVVEAIEAGINDYLVKPFDKDDLRGKVEKFCPASA